MSKSIKGTETEKNLLKAFAGESQARNRYTYFAGAARKAGYEQIAAIFRRPPRTRRSTPRSSSSTWRAARWRSPPPTRPASIGDTKANLEAAAAGERMEWSDIYARFEKTARAEGFPEIAASFKEIADVEEFHEKRYRKLAANIETGEVFKRPAAREVALHQLRLRPRGPGSARPVPGLQAPPGLLRDPGRELLSPRNTYR